MNQTTAKFEMLLSPRRLFFRVLVGLFLAELVVHFFLFRLERLVPDGFPQELLDSTTLSLILAPFLWYVVMPLMGGRELAERLAVLRPEMRVLFMSGYTDDAILRHGIMDKDIAFLQKPFTSESLVRKVAEVLQARSEGLGNRHSGDG
jgi:DNA-binding NarL/FixJ family response regulator